jgi:hypothetical protein
MAKKLNLKSWWWLLLIAGIGGLASCKKESLQQSGLNKEQLVAGRLDGTWTTPTNIITPENVPAEIFGTMRLVFTTDGAGNPSKFMAQDCPIVFGNAGNAGTWKVTGTQDSAKVNVTDYGPVDEFKVRVTSSTLTISFYMGWENTDTKATGKGTFQVTLTRQQ